MDKQTIERYQQDAHVFIDNYKSVKPRRVYELIATFFHPKELTLDIGCASGRDLAYLSGSGFIVEGMDPVPAFVEHCRHFLEGVPIYQDALPGLESQTTDNKFSNLLLCAVLMHIPQEHLHESVFNIIRITRPGGRIFLSIRKPRPDHTDDLIREHDERLYNYIKPKILIQLFEQLGARLKFHEEQIESARSGIIWDNFVFEKNLSDNKILKLNSQLVFTKDIKKCVEFYQSVLGYPPIEQDEFFASFQIGDSFLNVHPADEKSPTSTGGSIGYWLVEDLLNAIEPFLKKGAALYRGPLSINDYFGICQLIDPMGHVIGFEGKYLKKV